MPFEIEGIFEVHFRVKDRAISTEFYKRVLNLEFASEVAERDVSFLWIGKPGLAMLGLWGPNCQDAPVPAGRSHFAFKVPLEDILSAPSELKKMGVTALDFAKNPTIEPDVFAGLPAATLYFVDPDAHMLEFLCMLNQVPRPELGILKFSEWNELNDI